MFNLPLFLSFITLCSSFVLYLPILIIKRKNFKKIFINYIIFNIICFISYMSVFLIKIKIFQVPINRIGFWDLIYPTLYVFLFIFLLLFIRSIIKATPEKRKKILKITLIISVIWLIMFSVDFYRAQKNQLPIFCSKLFGIFSYQDGGTVEYIGLGYKVIAFNRLATIDTQKYWGNYKVTEKFICPWFIDYNTAFDILKNNKIKSLQE